MANKKIVLVMGPPSTGKTTSLLKLVKDPGVVYINTDLKEVPFKVPKGGMKQIEISDPEDITQAIEEIEDMDDIHTVVLDTITYLMEQYESQYVQTSEDTRSAWGGYSNFYRTFMHDIKAGTKTYIILGHQSDEFNEKTKDMTSRVPVKGAVGKIGVEADFTTIIGTKKVDVEVLEGIENELLNITKKEDALGIKYVFQTYLTRDTLHEKIRSHMDLWDESELYIDNDINHVINRLEEYYN